MNNLFCEKCGAIDFFDHSCEMFWVICEDLIDDPDTGDGAWQVIWGSSASRVAEQYAENRDNRQGEFTDEQTIYVKDASGIVMEFCVIGEMVRNYMVSEIGEKEFSAGFAGG